GGGGCAGRGERMRVRVGEVVLLDALHEATRASARVIERDGRRVGYVHVWASVWDFSDTLRAALEQIGFRSAYDRSTVVPPRDLAGLIVDMRGKIGGVSSTAARYLQLIDPRGPLVRALAKRGEASVGTPYLRGRTAVLIDHHTRSAAELFVHAYKRERQGPLIGTRTAGAVSAGTM